MSLRTLVFAAILLMGIGSSAHAVNRSNPLFGYTHQLPSPFTLPGGVLVFGTDIAYGVTDFLQVGSSLIQDLYQVYNANGKLAIFDNEAYALALNFGWESFNYRNISASNPDLQINSYSPGLVQGISLLPQVAWFLGGQLDFTQQTRPPVESVEVSGLTQGASVESDLAWAYNPSKKKVGNVLSVGASYDFTYKLMGVGFSHYWPGFRIGIHYYPEADSRKLVPIITGGGSVQL